MNRGAGKGGQCAQPSERGEWTVNSSESKLDVASALSIEDARIKNGKYIYAVEARYLGRLSALLRTGTTAGSPKTPSDRRPGSVLTRWLAGLRALRQLPALMGLVPTFIRQLSLLQAALRAGPEVRHLVVCVASNRMQIFQGDAPVRTELTTLTAALGGAPSPIERDVTRADFILVFDALPFSRAWQGVRRSNQPDVVMLDGAFLAFFFCSRLLSRAGRREILNAIREGLRREARNGTSFSAPKALLYTLILSGIWQALGGCARKEGLFVTSNSTLPELLRSCLFQSPRCDRIYEMMHGVGSICAERILGSGVELARNYGALRKMVFVPQIPGLPLEGVFRNLAFDPGTAVNCYLNKYFMKMRHSDVEASIVEEFNRLRAAANAGADPIIITIFGNFPNADKSSDSPSFRAEAALIGMIGRLSNSIGREHVIVYAPHPGMGRAPSGHVQFVENRVQIHPDSVFCWLISDLCVALNSSAMFEAVWFGASAMTPMVPDDQFYSPAYLAKLFHPVSGTSEELEEVVRAFLASWRREPGLDGAARAKKRLKAMIGNGPRMVNREGLS